MLVSWRVELLDTFSIYIYIYTSLAICDVGRPHFRAGCPGALLFAVETVFRRGDGNSEKFNGLVLTSWRWFRDFGMFLELVFQYLFLFSLRNFGKIAS